MQANDINKVRYGLAANSYAIDIAYTDKNTNSISTQINVDVTTMLNERWIQMVKDIETELVKMGLKGSIAVRDDSERWNNFHATLNDIVEKSSKGETPENLVYIEADEAEQFEEVAYFEDVVDSEFKCPHCDGDVSEVVISIFEPNVGSEKEEAEELEELEDKISESIIVRSRFGQDIAEVE